MKTISKMSAITRKTTPNHEDHKSFEKEDLFGLGCLTQIVRELDERITKLERKESK